MPVCARMSKSVCLCVREQKEYLESSILVANIKGTDKRENCKQNVERKNGRERQGSRERERGRESLQACVCVQ